MVGVCKLLIALDSPGTLGESYSLAILWKYHRGIAIPLGSLGTSGQSVTYKPLARDGFGTRRAPTPAPPLAEPAVWSD